MIIRKNDTAKNGSSKISLSARTRALSENSNVGKSFASTSFNAHLWTALASRSRFFHHKPHRKCRRRSYKTYHLAPLSQLGRTGVKTARWAYRPSNLAAAGFLIPSIMRMAPARLVLAGRIARRMCWWGPPWAAFGHRAE